MVTLNNLNLFLIIKKFKYFNLILKKKEKHANDTKKYAYNSR